MIFTKKAQRNTKDTKRSVVYVQLCVLCALFLSFVIKNVAFVMLYEIRGDECLELGKDQFNFK